MLWSLQASPVWRVNTGRPTATSHWSDVPRLPRKTLWPMSVRHNGQPSIDQWHRRGNKNWTLYGCDVESPQFVHSIAARFTRTTVCRTERWGCRNEDILIYLYYNSPKICRAVRKLQVAILARASREMYQTVRIDWQYILSRVQPSIFYMWKTPKNYHADRGSPKCLLNEQASGRKMV